MSRYFPTYDQLRVRLDAGAPRLVDLERLPPTARRWLARALPAGREVRGRVSLRIEGEIRLKDWTPFRSREVLAPRSGFGWEASVGRFPLVIRGMDFYVAGEGAMRWRLAGLIPVQRADGPDVSRSARGRAAAEAMLCPGALLAPDVIWRDENEETCVASWDLHGERMAVRFGVAADGGLRSASLARWSDHGGKGWRLQRFGALVEEERTFDGITIPSRIRAGWGFGTPEWEAGEFFRATVTEARWE